MSAQSVYADLVRSRLGPALRGEGLRGSSGRYYFPSATHFARVSVQKSAYSDRFELKFTVNLLCVSVEDWAAYRLVRPEFPAEPSAGSYWGGPVRRKRLGKLMPEGEDTWWAVKDDDDPLVVGDDMLQALKSHGLPWLRAQM